MKRISILGSTGSIGKNTLNVIRHLKDHFKVTALAAKSNITLLEEQIKEFQPEMVAVFDADQAMLLKKRIPNIPVCVGMEGLEEAAAHPRSDLVVSAISGTIGLKPTLAAIEAGKDIGLANKEVLVSGGEYVMERVKQKKIHLLPIDSEHSAIFQCLQGQSDQPVQRLILTASGGPFRTFSEQELEHVSPPMALNHPTWNMGAKITIDSSTLMNKGLEIIEAHWLFNIPVKNIEVIIHPESIIHSMVEFVDGSILAQMGEPTMITPIQYALTYPKRLAGSLKPFDFFRNRSLQFFLPDVKKFRCLSLAYFSLEKGESFPCYMNSANEELVYRFLNGKIGWKDIGEKLEKLLSLHKGEKLQSLNAILDMDSLAREDAKIV